MQIFNRIPTYEELVLNKLESDELIHQLYLPFSSEEEADTFWQTCTTQLFIFTHESDASLAQQLLNTQTKLNLKEALETPEFTHSISDELTLYLLITQDNGGGVYVVILDTNKSTLLTFL